MLSYPVTPDQQSVILSLNGIWSKISGLLPAGISLNNLTDIVEDVVVLEYNDKVYHINVTKQTVRIK